MLHISKINNKINRLHYRVLCIIYNRNQSTFKEPMELDNFVSVNNKKSQYLAIELVKIFSGISPDIIKDVVSINTTFNYDIKNRQDTESLSRFSPKIWKLIPEIITSIDSISASYSNKIAIKQWKPKDC